MQDLFGLHLESEKATVVRENSAGIEIGCFRHQLLLSRTRQLNRERWFRVNEHEYLARREED